MRLLRSLLVALLCLASTASQPFWQSRDSNYNVNIVSGGGGGASISALTAGTCTGASPCTIITGQTFTTSIVVVGLVADLAAGAGTPTAVTINGVTATQAGATITDTANTAVQLWYASVTSGTGNITETGGTGNMCASVWAITGASSSTPVSTNSFNGLSPTQADPQGPMSSITLASGDVGAFFIGGTFHTSTVNPTTWVQSTRDAAAETALATGNGCAVSGSHISAAGTYAGITAAGSASWLFSAMIGARWH